MKFKKVLSILIATITVVGVVGCSPKKDINAAVATVDGSEISLQQYESSLKAYKQMFEMYSGPDIWEQEVEKGVKYKDQFKESILDQLIRDEVVYQAAKKENLLPSEKDLNEEFATFKEDIDKDENYKKELEKNGISEAFLKEQLERDMAIQNYRDAFNTNTEISDEELKNYYDENIDLFKKDEVKASHILISTQDENGKDLSESKKKEAKQKAEDVLRKIKEGEDFATLAKEYSDDPGSGSNGGDLGFFGKGVMVTEFENAVFSMKVGEISDLVETTYGYHIIKVTDKVNETTPFEDVKDKIKTMILNDKFVINTEELIKLAKVERDENLIKDVKFN